MKEGVVVGLANHTILVARDGTEHPLDDSAAPIRGAGGEIVGAVLVFRDITERKQAEDALKEADRRKDDFIALLAHELRNPLAPLRNGLQVMRLAGGDANAVAQARAMMDRQLGHMVRLIDDLLDVSRISRNKMELRRSRVLLADVVSSAVETARPAIEAAGHELTVSLPPEPIFLDADLTRLAQVFSNLLTNSAKYTERGGRIWLAAERRDGDGDRVGAGHRDRHPRGRLAAHLRHVLPGGPAASSAPPAASASGWRSSRVSSRCTAARSRPRATGQGKGSTFTVTLPVLESRSEPLAAVAPDNGPAVRGPKRRILVVDDNRDSAASMAMMLKLLGNEVRHRPRRRRGGGGGRGVPARRSS